MVTTLDNEPVAQGDTLYAVGQGPGTVTELLSGGKMRVQFSGHGGTTTARTFGSDGKQVGAAYRSLYWHDPIVAIPLKSEAKWARAVPAIRAVLELFRAV